MRIDTRRVAAILSLAALVGCPHGQLDRTAYGGNQAASGPPAIPTVTLEVPASPTPEGSTLVVTVVLSNAYNATVTVPFTIILGTAGVSDFARATASPVTIPAGATRGTIEFPVIDDPYQEEPPVETFRLILGTPGNARLGATTSATLSISDADDDGLGSSISGRVTSALTGTGLADVSVNALSVGGGLASAITDALGFYTLASPAPAASIEVTYSKAGHVPQARTTEAMTTAQSAVVINVPMVPIAVTDTFDPTVAHVTTVAGSVAQVSFPANSLETAGGAAPTGNVTASVTPLAASADLNVLPGSYRAGDGVTSPVPVETFGALAIDVSDAAGNPLGVVSGQSVTVRIASASRGTSPPASVSLYYFDPADGLWHAEGTATRVGTGTAQYYEGTVSRLAAVWSVNAAYTVAQTTGCVVDPTGSRVAGAVVIVEGTDYSGNAAAVTNAEGDFSVATRDGGGSYVQATYRTGISNAVDVPPLEVDTCLLVFPGAASIKLTWGGRPLDLDSHTFGPNQDSHVRWDGQGSLTALPFIALDVDDVTGFGPEVTTIVKAARSRSYRFMVQNFSDTYTPGQTGSPARVELFIRGRQTVFTPPPGETSGTPTWHVFDLQSDANCEITVVTPAAVPWLALNEFTLDEPAANPNPDNNATFCN